MWILNGVVLKVVRGDITEMDVDAIVNPANSLLVMGGGVAGAIKRRGGREIEAEALKHAPLPVGKAIATGGGKLKVKYVIHAPTMERPAMRTTVDKVAKAAGAAVKLAVNMGLKSLAIPGMGTGVGGVSVYEAVSVMLRAIAEVLARNSGKLREIFLVAYSERDYEEFVRAALDFFSRR